MRTAKSPTKAAWCLISIISIVASFLNKNDFISSCRVSALSFPVSRQAQESKLTSSRRDAIFNIFTGCTSTALCILPSYSLLSPPANAVEDNQVLTDEEMAAKIARKMELLRAAKNPSASSARATDIRSDINPEAAVNLRSRSAIENAKIAMEKQKELKARDKMQKREDLCEMLGRGC